MYSQTLVATMCLVNFSVWPETAPAEEVIVKVNGDLVNHATQVSQTRGAIALQSEGTPIEFRNIELQQLKDQ